MSHTLKKERMDTLRNIMANAKKLMRWSSTHNISCPPPLGAPFPLHLLPATNLPHVESQLCSLGVSTSKTQILSQMFTQKISQLRTNFSDRWKSSSVPISPAVVSAVQVYYTQVEQELLASLFDVVESRLSNLAPVKPSFNSEYIPFFEKYFEHNSYPSLADRQAMARKSMMAPRQIEVWFQNRRAKAKKEGSPLKRTKPSDPILDLSSLEELKETMPHFYIPESERQSANLIEEPRLAPRPGIPIQFSFERNPLNPPDTQEHIPKFDPSQLRPNSDSSFITQFPHSSSPSGGHQVCPVSYQSFEDLASQFMCMSVFDPKSRKMDTKAAVAAFTNYCPSAPHPSRILYPDTAYIHPPIPIDLHKQRKYRSPNWIVPWIDTTPPHHNNRTTHHNNTSLTALPQPPLRRQRKVAPLPKRTICTHPSRSSSIASISSRHSSSSFSSASSAGSYSGPSTPEAMFSPLPLGSIASGSPDSLPDNPFTAWASQKSLLTDRIEVYRQSLLPPEPAFDSEPMWPDMQLPTFPMSNEFGGQIHPIAFMQGDSLHSQDNCIPSPLEHTVSRFNEPNPLHTFPHIDPSLYPTSSTMMNGFSMGNGSELCLPPSMTMNFNDIFDLEDFVGVFNSEPSFNSATQQDPVFDSITWGETAAPSLDSSFLDPPPTFDFDSLISC